MKILPLLALVSLAFAAKKPVTLEDSLKARPARGGADAVWAPDGKQFAYTEGGKLCLYEVSTGKRRDVIAWKVLEEAAVKPPAAAIFDWTNRRVSNQSRQWFSDGKRMLVSANGDLFTLDPASGKFEPLTHTVDAEQDPKLSPDNTRVSFRRGHDLYAIEVASKAVTRLTDDGSDTLLNGQLDWVYPEELDLGTAHWWSPDSRSIAYLQFDTSREPVFPQVSLLNTRGQLEPERLPQAGRSERGCAPGRRSRQRRQDQVDGFRRNARPPDRPREVAPRQRPYRGGEDEPCSEPAGLSVRGR